MIVNVQLAVSSLATSALQRSSSPASRTPSASASRQNVAVVLFLYPLAVAVIESQRPPSLPLSSTKRGTGVNFISAPLNAVVSADVVTAMVGVCASGGLVIPAD